MAQRSYRLGRRQASVDRTAASILVAARELVAGGSRASVGEIARRAGVSRITVYNRFGSRARVLES
ncbi:MAG TPA: TetR family transcriptional regulator, partial [Candidatus Dormibacteraeota bacterium]|nr:TetR family transcriptional regulator [Candidatus Dormibacteraeota bacterium]